MARSRFTTHLGRAKHHQLRTRRGIRHHGFRSEFHRRITHGRYIPHGHHHRHRAGRFHVPMMRVAGRAQVIKKKQKAKARARALKSKTGPKWSHTKVSGNRRVVTTHPKQHHAGGRHSGHHGPRRRGVHAVHRTVAGHGKRHLSPETRAKISAAMRGKHHPHRGHAMSAATRAKISQALHNRLKGRPHPHKGHHLSNQARAKISKAEKGKPHRRRSARKKK
jgi:hypothetical protein